MAPGAQKNLWIAAVQLYLIQFNIKTELKEQRRLKHFIMSLKTDHLMALAVCFKVFAEQFPETVQ